MHGRDADISTNTFRAPFTEPEVGRHLTEQLVDLLVVHAIAEYIEDDTGVVWPVWNYLEHRGLSCHDLVMPSGVHLECRDASRGVEKAWHARGYNGRSVGIEVVVPGVHTYASFLRAINSHDWVAYRAYEKAVDVAVKRCRTFNLDPEAQMKRHSDIDPDRKQDPGDGFPWDPFVTDVAAAVRGGGVP